MMKGSGQPRTVIGLGLMLMSFASGCLDVLSYRFLGEVFPSAMTGNVALMGLSLGQANLVGALRNVTAFAGFLTGLATGAVLLRGTATRSSLLWALGSQVLLLAGFALLWRQRGADEIRYGLIGVSALAMGVQSAVAHRIGVKGVTTTYFTGTLVNIMFGLLEPQPAGAPRVPALRRVSWPVLAFLAYLTGAVLAGWHTAGKTGADISLALPMLPAAAAMVLFVTIAVAGPKRA